MDDANAKALQVGRASALAFMGRYDNAKCQLWNLTAADLAMVIVSANWLFQEASELMASRPPEEIRRTAEMLTESGVPVG